MAEEIKILSQNKKAHFNFTIEDSLECGISLGGTEVKSIKDGRFSYPDSYATIYNDELWLIAFHISPYPFGGNAYNHDPDRKKKLLAHRQEIKRLKRKTDEKGFTLIPLKVYLKKGLIKIELGICKGKKAYDKRSDIKDRDLEREASREFRLKL